MTALSPELERKIVDALTDPDNDWMSTWQQSYAIIRGQYACSAVDAEEILTDLAKRGRIFYVGEHRRGGGSGTASRLVVHKRVIYKWKRQQG